MVDANQRNWCELTPYVAFACNTSYHSSTAFSSFYLLYLREARLPIDLALETVGEAVLAEWDDYVTEVRSRMERIFQTVRDQLGHAFERAKQVYDGRVKKLQFKVDDLVWFFCSRKRPRLGLKWQLLTTRLWNSVNCVIRRVGGRNHLIVHVDRLQRYVEAAPDGVVPACQPGPNCKDLLSRPRPRGRVSANLPPHTVEVEEMSQQIRRPQRLLVESARLRDCRQMGRRTSSDEAEIDRMIYPYPRDFVLSGTLC